MNGKLDSVDISGEALYDGSQAALRSEEISSKWLTISEDDLKDLADENGLDLDDLKDTISESINQFSEISKSVQIDEKTQKEINEKYSKILKDYINEKSKDIKSEKGTVEVDGKEKKCTKLTLKLNEKDIKKLAKKYLDAFAKDDQLKEILTNSAQSYAEVMKTAGDTTSAKNITNAVDELYNNIDKIKEEIDNADFTANIKLVVYSSNTNVYRTDIILDVEDTEVSVETTFNDDIVSLEKIFPILLEQCDVLATRMRRKKKKCTCISVTFRTLDFRNKSHQTKLPNATDITEEIYRNAQNLFQESWMRQPLRLLGVSLTGLTDDSFEQLSFFENTHKKERQQKLDAALDSIRLKYGNDKVTRASIMNSTARIGRKAKAQMENEREQ